MNKSAARLWSRAACFACLVPLPLPVPSFDTTLFDASLSGRPVGPIPFPGTLTLAYVLVFSLALAASDATLRGLVTDATDAEVDNDATDATVLVDNPRERAYRARESEAGAKCSLAADIPRGRPPPSVGLVGDVDEVVVVGVGVAEDLTSGLPELTILLVLALVDGAVMGVEELASARFFGGEASASKGEMNSNFDLLAARWFAFDLVESPECGGVGDANAAWPLLALDAEAEAGLRESS